MLTVAEEMKIKSDLLPNPTGVGIFSDLRKRLLSYVIFVPTVTLNVSCASAAAYRAVADSHAKVTMGSQRRQKQERFCGNILLFRVLSLGRKASRCFGMR